MIEFEKIIEGIIQTSWIEWCAVATSIAYVVLAALKKNSCWIFAGIASILYIYLCISVSLYLESVLQVFYLIMAIVGWLEWNKSDPNQADIKTWSIHQHGLNILISGIVAFLLGYVFQKFTDQQSPYVDAFTTVFSLAATFMVTKKVLENWIYWIVIDAVSIYLYHQRGLELTAALFALYTIIAAIGFFMWYRNYKFQKA